MKRSAACLLRACLVTVWAFVLPPAAFADETICQSGLYECSEVGTLPFTYSAGGSPCMPPPPLAPGDPIYTPASVRTGGFT